MADQIIDIAAMPSWHFWSSPRFVGMTEEQVERAEVLPPRRVAEINFRLDATYDYLCAVPVDNRCGRCS